MLKDGILDPFDKIDEDGDDVLHFNGFTAKVRWSNALNSVVLVTEETSDGRRAGCEIETVQDVIESLKDLVNNFGVEES